MLKPPAASLGESMPRIACSKVKNSEPHDRKPARSDMGFFRTVPELEVCHEISSVHGRFGDSVAHRLLSLTYH